MKDKRKSTHRKLTNSVSKGSKIPKKYELEEMTVLKQKRDKFNPNHLTHFSREDGVGAFNN